MSRSASPASVRSTKTPVGYNFLTDTFGDLVAHQSAGLNLDEATARASVEAELRAEGKFENLDLANPRSQATIKRSVTRRMNSMKDKWRRKSLPRFNKREWKSYCKALYQAVSDIGNIERIIERTPGKKIELGNTYEITIRNSTRIIHLPQATTLIDRSWISAVKAKLKEEIRVLVPTLAGIRSKRKSVKPKRRLIGSPYKRELYDWILGHHGEFGLRTTDVDTLLSAVYKGGYLWLPTLAPKSIFRAWIDNNPESVEFSESLTPKLGKPTKVFKIKSNSSLGALITLLDPDQKYVRYDDSYIQEVYVNSTNTFARLNTDRGLLSLNPILTVGLSKEEKASQPVSGDELHRALTLFSIDNRQRPRTPSPKKSAPVRASGPRSPRARASRA